jgi:C1A family cysteine protease
MAPPPVVDLTSFCPAVWDQGDLGSCTAHAGSALASFVMKKKGYRVYMPARLCIYYWTRLAEGTPNEDSGATLTDTMKTLSRYGIPNETGWRYDIRRFRVKPGPVVTQDGKNHRMATGLAVNQNLDDFKACLAEGWPFMFGFAVYESFDNIGSNGIMPMPKTNEDILGGHAVLAVGYDDNKQMFKIRNSWGKSWGAQGYFWMPYTFITDHDYADDFWTCHDFTTFKK